VEHKQKKKYGKESAQSEMVRVKVICCCEVFIESEILSIFKRNLVGIYEKSFLKVSVCLRTVIKFGLK